MIDTLNSFVLDKNNDIKRDLITHKRHTDNKKFDSTDLSQYDYYTIFYDIFLSPNNNKLILIGPPLLNLKNILLPLKISFNNYVLNNYQIIEDSVTIIIYDLENQVINDYNNVDIHSKNEISKSFIIPKNIIKIGKNVLVTIQKSNNILWIEEWIRHYKNIGVNTFIIFDNNSENQLELIENYKENIDIFIIPTNFLYGIIKSHASLFLQRSILNICLYKYCNDNFIFNFDIDELLNISKDRLEKLLKPNNYYIFNFKWVPVLNVLDTSNSYSNSYSYKDFDKSLKKITRTAPKYIIHSNNTRKITIHGVDTKNKKNTSSLYFYHYKGITTNWKVYCDRLKIEKINQDELEDIKFN